MNKTVNVRACHAFRKPSNMAAAPLAAAPLHVVAVDMDGTFLSPDGTVSSRNRRLVKDLLARNIAFAIATGRPAAALQPFIDSLGLTCPAVTFNGAYLAHARAGESMERASRGIQTLLFAIGV